METPSSTHGLLACVRGEVGSRPDAGEVVAVEEDSLPDFEVHEEPEAITVRARGRAVLLGEPAERGGREELPLERARPEYELVDDGPEAPLEPPPHGHRESHLPPAEDGPRDAIAKRLPQHRLGPPAAQREALRDRVP